MRSSSAARSALAVRCASFASASRRVGLLINNRPEWLEAFFGTQIAGGVVVAFSTWSTPDELDWLLQDSAVRMLIALDRFGDNDFTAALADRWESRRYPALRHVALLGDNLPHRVPPLRHAAGSRTVAAPGTWRRIGRIG